MRNNSSAAVVPSGSISSGRRRFLGRACGAAIATVVASTSDQPILKPFATAVAQAGSPNRSSRIEQAYEMREQAARYQEGLAAPSHSTNGDEELYPNKIASYSKALQHDEIGRVVPAAYSEFVSALASGESARIERLQLGGGLKLVNPQAALGFGLEGADSHTL